MLVEMKVAVRNILFLFASRGIRCGRIDAVPRHVGLGVNHEQ